MAQWQAERQIQARGRVEAANGLLRSRRLWHMALEDLFLRRLGGEKGAKPGGKERGERMAPMGRFWEICKIGFAAFIGSFHRLSYFVLQKKI
jgi:hypothetical protein